MTILLIFINFISLSMLLKKNGYLSTSHRFEYLVSYANPEPSLF